MKKKTVKHSIIVLLALLMAIMSPLESFAAGTKTYISDVVTYYASTYEEAKTGLEALGYTVVEKSNLNSTLGTGVYLGYTTTTDPDEAITDLATMNMNGSYNYTDYEEILEGEREEIQKKLEELMPAIAAFQDSYNEGKVSGRLVYSALNQYYDEDTFTDMGDLLLAYDFSSEKEEELTEIFLQGSSAVILDIIQILALSAGDPDGMSILESMAEIGLDGVYDAYLFTLRANNRKTSEKALGKKALEAMNRDLGNTVVVLQNNWNGLYEILSDTEQYISIDGEEVTVTIPEMESDNDMTEAVSQSEILENVNLYLNLYYTVLGEEEDEDGEVKEVTALDYFKRPMDGSFNITDLYLVAYCLTEAQVGLLNYISLSKLLSFDSYALDDGSAEAEEALKTYADEAGLKVSVYEGIDRSYFEKGVAFTSEATKHESLYGESWSPEGTSFSWMTSMIVTSAVAVACAGVGAGVLIYAKSSYNKGLAALQSKVTNTANNYKAIFSEFSPTIDQYYKQAKVYENAKDLYQYGKMTETEFATIEHEYVTLKSVKEHLNDKYLTQPSMKSFDAKNELQTYRETGISRSFKVFACVMFALAIVFAVLDVISIIAYFTADEPEEANVPVHIVTAETDGDGKEDYVYYSAVKNQFGEAADLNNHEAPSSTGWLVLYYTKDPLAGDPITADALKVQTGSSQVPEDSFGIHMFNEEAPINLTDEVYTGVSDSAKGTYVFFERGTSLAIGSAISQGMAFVYAGAGLVVGVLIGTLVSRKVGKKKKAIA